MYFAYHRNFAFVAAAMLVAGASPAVAQTRQTLGEETTLQLFCTWMSGPSEKSISQIEEVKWRDTINHYEDGKRFIAEHNGSYINGLANELKDRLGNDSVDCHWALNGNYRYYSPNSSYEAVGGRIITTVLKPLDPSWFVVKRLEKNLKVVSLEEKKRPATAEGSKKPPAPDASAESNRAPSGPTAAEIAAERHRAVVERNRAAQEKYEAELAEQKRKVEEYERAKAEVARKKAEQQAAAAKALAEHDARRAASNELLKRYDAEQRRHNACVTGDKQACSDIAGGKPASETKLADAGNDKGKASTDTDANQCVTSAELRHNDTFKGNTAAYIVNGCGQAVDVRVCLMTESGKWNCGVTYGLPPQRSWSYSSFKATGQTFVNARTAGSGKPLASPN